MQITRSALYSSPTRGGGWEGEPCTALPVNHSSFSIPAP